MTEEAAQRVAEKLEDRTYSKEEVDQLLKQAALQYYTEDTSAKTAKISAPTLDIEGVSLVGTTTTTLNTLGRLDWLGTLVTLNTLGTLGRLGTLEALEALEALVTLGTLVTLNTLGTLGTLGRLGYTTGRDIYNVAHDDTTHIGQRHWEALHHILYQYCKKNGVTDPGDIGTAIFGAV